MYAMYDSSKYLKWLQLMNDFTEQHCNKPRPNVHPEGNNDIYWMTAAAAHVEQGYILGLYIWLDDGVDYRITYIHPVVQCKGRV